MRNKRRSKALRSFTSQVIGDWFSVVFFVAILFVPVLFMLRGCTDTVGATRVLRQQGYTDIEITGWRPLMAGKDDVYSTGFRARSVSGETVTGAVTGGLFKGHTIRLD